MLAAPLSESSHLLPSHTTTYSTALTRVVTSPPISQGQRPKGQDQQSLDASSRSLIVGGLEGSHDLETGDPVDTRCCPNLTEYIGFTGGLIGVAGIILMIAEAENADLPEFAKNPLLQAALSIIGTVMVLIGVFGRCCRES